VGAGGEIALACAEVVELAAESFGGGDDQVLDLIGRKEPAYPYQGHSNLHLITP